MPKNRTAPRPKRSPEQLACVLARRPIIDEVEGTYSVAGRVFPLSSQQALRLAS